METSLNRVDVAFRRAALPRGTKESTCWNSLSVVNDKTEYIHAIEHHLQTSANSRPATTQTEDSKAAMPLRKREEPVTGLTSAEHDAIFAWLVGSRALAFAF